MSCGIDKSTLYRYVFQVVIPRQLAAKDLVKVLDGGKPTVLPAWDPMVRLPHVIET